MANNPKFSTAFRTVTLESGMDALFDSGFLEIRSGAQPADADQAPVGTLLASIPVPADSFIASVAGVKAKNGTWEDTSADDTGTATWFRLLGAGDAGTTNTVDPRIDGTVGASGSFDCLINTTSITAGDKVVIDSFNVNAVA